MASGRVHFLSNVIAGTGVAIWTHNNFPEATPYVVIGLAIGALITPDMDLEGTTYTERIMRKIPLFGWAWQVNWYGYALRFKHRGLSHGWPATQSLLGLFIGTASRVIWLGAIFLFFNILAIGAIDQANKWLALGWPVPYIDFSLVTDMQINAFITVLIAWWLQDFNHYILDFVFSEGKSRKKKRFK